MRINKTQTIGTALTALFASLLFSIGEQGKAQPAPKLPLHSDTSITNTPSSTDVSIKENQSIDMFSLLESTSAVASVVITLIAFLYATREYRRQFSQQQAAQIRQDLRTIVKGSKELYYRLEDAACLITAAAAITKELNSRLSSSPTQEELFRYLGNEKLMRSVATQGWHSSPITPQFEEKLNQLKQAGIGLNGKLRIVSNAVQLYTNLVQKKCSPDVFVKILLKVHEVATQENLKSEQSINELINQLTVILQKTSVKFCLNTYLDEMKLISDLICKLSSSLINMDDRQLLKMAMERFREETLASEEENLAPVSELMGVDNSIIESAENLVWEFSEIKAYFNGQDRLYTYEKLSKMLQENKDKLEQESQRDLIRELENCLMHILPNGIGQNSFS